MRASLRERGNTGLNGISGTYPSQSKRFPNVVSVKSKIMQLCGKRNTLNLETGGKYGGFDREINAQHEIERACARQNNPLSQLHFNGIVQSTDTLNCKSSLKQSHV